MADESMTTEDGAAPGHTVSRPELEARIRSVNETVSNLAGTVDTLAGAIRDEAKNRAADTETLRRDIREAWQASATGRQANFPALRFSFGIFSFVMLGYASLYIWGEARVQAEKDIYRAQAIDEIVDIRRQMRSDDERERSDAERFAELSEKDKEIETQFKWIREVLELKVEALEERFNRHEQGTEE